MGTPLSFREVNVFVLCFGLMENTALNFALKSSCSLKMSESYDFFFVFLKCQGTKKNQSRVSVFW